MAEVGFEGLLSGGSDAKPTGGYYPAEGMPAEEEVVESFAMDQRDRTRTTSGDAKFGVDRGVRGVFFQDGVRRIDYVMAYESGLTDDNKWSQTRAEKRKIFERALTDDYQLELEQLYDEGKTSFVKVHLPFPVLCKGAEELLMRMPMQEDNKTIRSSLERVLDCCCCGNSPFDNDLPEEPNQYTGIFTRNNLNKFINHDQPNIFFTSAQRSRIAYEILSKARYGEKDDRAARDEESRAHEKTKVGVDRLIGNKSYKAAYPLHDGDYDAEEGSPEDNARAKLYRNWGDWRHGNWHRLQPLDHIRNYYGEKIAIYFAWLGYYTSVLIIPSIVGLVVFIIGCIIAYGGTHNVGWQVCNLKGLNASSPLCQNPSYDSNLKACYDILMCPLCDSGCDYWRYSSACQYSQATLIFDNPATVFFAAFMALWATFFLEFWKRQQNEIAFDWDLADFEEEEERPRPSFEAKIRRLRPNPVTHMEEPYQAQTSYYAKILSALSVLFFFVLLVLSVLVAVIIYRIVVAEAFYKLRFTLAGIATTLTASIIQVICIMLLSKVYEFLAVKLTEWELHRTQTEHEDSFTFKMFLFQFTNFYGSIFYIAFFKGNFAGYPPEYEKLGSYRLDECGSGGCLIELTIQLAIIMVAKQALNNFMEVVLPRIKVFLARRDNVDAIPHRLEADLDLNPLPDYGLFSEYLEMVLQYGFVTLFVTAFPLAPIFALVNNIIEIRLDANKLLTQTRRPFAARAEDIGIWYGILDALSTMAVITNGLVIALTSGFIPRIVYEYTVQNKYTIYGEYKGSNRTTEGFAPFSISLTSPAVFRELENRTANNPMWLGNSTVRSEYLTSTGFSEDNLVCGYRGPLRLPNGPDGTADLTTFYWHSIAARLAFLIVFEHIVFFIKYIIAWVVPDVPRTIGLQKQREAFVAKTTLRGQDPVDGSRGNSEVSSI